MRERGVAGGVTVGCKLWELANRGVGRGEVGREAPRDPGGGLGEATEPDIR